MIFYYEKNVADNTFFESNKIGIKQFYSHISNIIRLYAPSTVNVANIFP